MVAKEDPDYSSRVGEIMTRFSSDIRQMSASLEATLDQTPEVRVYLKDAGVESIKELSPEQMQELLEIVFRAMNHRVHPGAN